MAVKTFDDDQRSYYHAVRGLRTGIYYAPYLPTSRLRLQHDNSVGFSSFDDEFPSLLDIGDFLYDRTADLPNRDLVAIVDAGVAVEHPLLRPRIVACQDFSGESNEDRSGHGTMRALQALNHQPTARFLVAKVVGTRPGTRQSLVDAIHWAIEQEAGVFYLALGEYNLLCRGGCRLCRAVREAVETHRVVIAAPGNRRHRVACPAKARGVTSTVATRWHRRRMLFGVTQKADLSTIPAYFWYPGERANAPRTRTTPRAAKLETYRESFRRAKESGPKGFSDFLRSARDFLSRILTGPLPDQIAAVDEIWERVSDGLLDALRNNGGCPEPVFPESMWVPLYGIPADRSIWAAVPREVPQAARHLITQWEYAWGNLARVFWGPNRETFREKAAAHLQAYIATHPNDADAHYQLGVIDLMAGFLVKARESLLRARQSRPDWPALSAALQYVQV